MTPTNHPHMIKSDLIEKKDLFLLKMDLPGFRREDILLSVDHGILLVTASGREDEKSKHYLRQERRTGNCQRTFRLSRQADGEAITAVYQNGVLTVTIPKISPDIMAGKGRIAIQ